MIWMLEIWTQVLNVCAGNTLTYWDISPAPCLLPFMLRIQTCTLILLRLVQDVKIRRLVFPIWIGKGSYCAAQAGLEHPISLLSPSGAELQVFITMLRLIQPFRRNTHYWKRLQFIIFKHQMKFKISQLLHYILYKENTPLEKCQSLYLMQLLGSKCLVSKSLKTYELYHRSLLPF